MPSELDQSRARAFKTAQVAMENFEASRNPLFLFQAASACLEADMPLPEQARIHVSQSLGKLAALRGKIGNPKAEVFACLGINNRSGPSVFTQAMKYEIDQRILGVAKALNISLEQACEKENRNPEAFQKSRYKRKKP
jgi:hypothetical protein